MYEALALAGSEHGDEALREDGGENLGGQYEGRPQTIVGFDHSRFCGLLRSLIFVLKPKGKAFKGFKRSVCDSFTCVFQKDHCGYNLENNSEGQEWMTEHISLIGPY